jgi:hypothetical protein
MDKMRIDQCLVAGRLTGVICVTHGRQLTDLLQRMGWPFSVAIAYAFSLPKSISNLPAGSV